MVPSAGKHATAAKGLETSAGIKRRKNGCMLSLMAFSADTKVNKVNVNGPKNISTRENAI